MIRSPEPTPSSKDVRKHRRRIWSWRLACALRGRPGAAGALADDPDLPDFSIALIAVGPRFRRWARTLIASIRVPGGYSGPVYVVTDAPAAFADLDRVAAVRVAPSRHSLVAKTCKTFLYRWIPRRYVLYVDADIIVGQSLISWCRAAVRELQARRTCSALFYPDYGRGDMPYHGGLILLDTRVCGALFDRWRGQLNSGRYFKDQQALRTIAGDEEIAFFPERGLMFPDERAIEQRQTACFIHLTRERYTRLGHERVRHYLRDVLGIEYVDERLDHSK